MAEVKQADSSGEPLNIEYRALAKDGQIVWLHNLNQRVQAPNTPNRSYYRHGVMFDISQHKQLEQQYQQAQKMEAVGQLTAGIAHDFNNLIVAINGTAEVMQMNLRPEDPFLEMIDTILRSGAHAANLIRQLLIFSRKQIVEPEIVDLNNVVLNMGKLLRRIIGEHIQVTTNLVVDLWSIKIDLTQIEQVIVNLAVNARDAMPNGGELIIETSNLVVNPNSAPQSFEIPAGRYVQLTVRDTGIGIAPEVQLRIFEPFFTTKEVGKGSGLGLATVYGIVKQHNGYIFVISNVGQGTTFKIYLPGSEETPLPLTPSSETIKEMPSGQATILVVEDDAAIRKIIHDVLRKKGYTLLLAQNGQEALKIASHHTSPIHLLLTDIIMPKMGGDELAEQLAQTNPQLKVIFMSGYTDEIISHHGILEPGINFLQKPFSFMDMVRKVQEVLR